MNNSIAFFRKETNLIDKFLIIFISLMPMSLAISIFAADLMASISGLIILFKFFDKDSKKKFITIKKEIIIFLTLYLIILISLLLTEYKSYSFLASFFYFRYFLLSLAFFYLLKKYEKFFVIFCISMLVTIGIVTFDSFLQYFFNFNLSGFSQIQGAGSHFHITSFFGDEKKLGSYLVRLLPLMLSLIYFYKPKIPFYFEIIILALIGSIIFFTTERTALFLLLLVYLSYFLVSNKKIIFSIGIFIVFVFLFSLNNDLKVKYIEGTIKQTGIKFFFEESPRPVEKDIPRYYSYEHENLSFTGIEIFKNNFLFGSGVKNFYNSCLDLKPKFQYKINQRNNRLICSTHPHNTYIQILSEIGILGFFIIAFIFLKFTFINLKIFLKKDKNNFDKSYFFINLTFIINLMPLIPSGSFFNNWMCLIMFFPIGFWLYIKEKYTK